MNIISILICIEINSQYQNINLSCAIIIEIKDAAFDNISTIEIKQERSKKTSWPSRYNYFKNKQSFHMPLIKMNISI